MDKHVQNFGFLSGEVPFCRKSSRLCFLVVFLSLSSRLCTHRKCLQSWISRVAAKLRFLQLFGFFSSWRVWKTFWMSSGWQSLKLMKKISFQDWARISPIGLRTDIFLSKLSDWTQSKTIKHWGQGSFHFKVDVFHKRSWIQAQSQDRSFGAWGLGCLSSISGQLPPPPKKGNHHQGCFGMFCWKLQTSKVWLRKASFLLVSKALSFCCWKLSVFAETAQYGGHGGPAFTPASNSKVGVTWPCTQRNQSWTLEKAAGA